MIGQGGATELHFGSKAKADRCNGDREFGEGGGER